ncbi:MAG TPA: hypothetical protein VIL28_13160 [Steroidobacteraceae bacterium]
MMRIGILVCVALWAVPAVAAEDFRVMKLEQDMRNLERQVQSLEREVRMLVQRTRSAVSPPELPSSERESDVEQDRKWLSAASWNRIRTGMDELEVIEILGKPTAVRPAELQRRALLYTLEIGTTGFLTGSVIFENGRVVEIQRPALR